MLSADNADEYWRSFWRKTLWWWQWWWLSKFSAGQRWPSSGTCDCFLWLNWAKFVGHSCTFSMPDDELLGENRLGKMLKTWRIWKVGIWYVNCWLRWWVLEQYRMDYFGGRHCDDDAWWWLTKFSAERRWLFYETWECDVAWEWFFFHWCLFLMPDDELPGKSMLRFFSLKWRKLRSRHMVCQ